MVACSPVAVSDIEIIWYWLKCNAYLAFIDVNSIKFVYGVEIEIEERIYIRFAKTHLCGQV